MTTHHTDSRRRWVCSLALVLSPGLLVVQGVVTPDDGSGAVIYDAAANHRGALLASAALIIASGMLMAPAAGGVLSMARGRGGALADAGAVLAVLGGTGHIALGYYYVMASALPGGDRAQMTAYIDRLGASPQLGIFVFPLLLCFALAVVAMPWAAYRAGAVGRWAPIVAGVGVLLHEGLPPEVPHQELIGLAILIALTVVHGYLGLVLVRGSRVVAAGTPDAVPVSARAQATPS